MKILGIIPARGGSKGVPRKNLYDLLGKPLIAYVIEAALKARALHRVIVSTEDKEIAKVARDLGAEVPFLRPRELAADDVSLIPVLQHAVRELERTDGWSADIIASIQPTSPLVGSADIDSAVRKLLQVNCDSVVSVCKILHGHPYRAMKLEGDRLIPLFPQGEQYLQKQDLPSFYMFNGAIFVRKRRLLEEWSGKDFALGKDVRAIVMDVTKSINIDTQIDLALAEILLRRSKSY
jgi:CMP-N-acetylneuraminic acid synthetase